MAKAPKKTNVPMPTEEQWARFVNALDVVLKSPPQPKKAKKKAASKK